jgi:Polysaccharide lyase family 4, domain II
MRMIHTFTLGSACCIALLFIGCSNKTETKQAAAAQPAKSFYKVDPATAGSITGTVHFSGKWPARKLIDMSGDPACVEAHHGKAYDESLIVGSGGSLANAFIYVKAGLEGKNFEVPATPVTIVQSGCWFRPRVLGIQTNQTLQVANSDPVTHNIHPMAQVNREWNHSQGPGDAPINRKFIKSEIMIPVKCNIHSWMHAFIGVVDHPYFAVSKDDGSFEIKNLPPGTYTIAAWQERLGTLETQVTIAPGKDSALQLSFKGQ